MSVFPKRVVAGETITLHTNVFSRHQSRVIYPYVTTVIRSPSGKVYSVFKGHVLLFPINAEQGEYKANKGFPFLLLAKAIRSRKSARETKELVDRIRQGKHFYFHFTLPADAEPGKYAIETNNWLLGKQAVSTTASEDHFFVEEISVRTVKKGSGKETAIRNHSPESLPVRIVRIRKNNRITSLPLVINGREQAIVQFEHNAFLLYNEERKCIPLDPLCKKVVIRNQELIHKDITENKQKVTYVMSGPDEVVSLKGKSKSLWDRAVQLHLVETKLNDVDRKILRKMKQSNLLQSLDLGKLLGQ